MFLSTESPFPSGRLQQLAAYHPAASLDAVLIKQLGTVEEQWLTIFDDLPRVMTTSKSRLIVIDSITNLFRAEHADDARDRAQHILRLCARLRQISFAFQAPVVIVRLVVFLSSLRFWFWCFCCCHCHRLFKFRIV